MYGEYMVYLYYGWMYGEYMVDIWINVRSAYAYDMTMWLIYGKCVVNILVSGWVNVWMELI